MSDGPKAGLALLDRLGDRLGQDHRLPAARAHLMEMAGDPAGAREAYLEAARLARSLPVQRYLNARAAGT